MNNYVFFGTPDFAATILEKLIGAGFLPAAVVCNPDRPVGRKKVLTAPPTKILAQKYNIPVLQPENIRTSDVLTLTPIFGTSDVRKFDILIVAAYAKIIPEEILQIPRLGTIGVHPSLLPRHRGASPIQSAILEGDEVTGVTLYLLDEKMDHGPIITGREFPIFNLQFSTLRQKLAELGGELLIETLPKFVSGEIKPQVQNEEYATYTKKFKTEDAYVDLEKDSPAIIEKKVRALNPEPGVWTMQNGKRMKILEAEFKDGKLTLKKIQFEGKTPQFL